MLSIINSTVFMNVKALTGRGTFYNRGGLNIMCFHKENKIINLFTVQIFGLNGNISK